MAKEQEKIKEILLFKEGDTRGQGLKLAPKTWSPYVSFNDGIFYGDIYISFPDGSIKAGKVKDPNIRMGELTDLLQELGYSKVSPVDCGLCTRV